MIVVIGLMFASLLALAFAGAGLGTPSYPSTTDTPAPQASNHTAIGAAVFLLLLAGIVAKHSKAREEDF